MLRYRLRTLLNTLKKYDCQRVQLTLVLGCIGLAVVSGMWNFGNGPHAPLLVQAALLGLATVSVLAVAEGVWKLDN